MNLLLRREQTAGGVGRVNFKLWAKVELTDDEQAMIKRYRFDQAILIKAVQPRLLLWSIAVGLLVLVIVLPVAAQSSGRALGAFVAICLSLLSGYWFFHSRRETIYVRDLIHGRHFKCPSVIELARKEAWLGVVVSFLRQVMESAKHWDGTEKVEIEALPKAEAKLVMLRGL